MKNQLNQINSLNSQEIPKNNESENNVEETTNSLFEDKIPKNNNIMLNDYNYIKSKYSEAENTINKLKAKNKELENEISILKRNKSYKDLNEANQEKEKT